MKNSKKIALTSVIALMVMSPLVGCGNEPGPAPKPVPEVVDSLKSAMLYLNRGNNYTCTLQENGHIFAHDYFYTKDSIGLVCEGKPTLDKIYYQDGNKGVYSIGYNGKTHVSSEYYNSVSKNVWSGKFYVTMKGAATDYVEALDETKTTLSVKNKEYRTTFLTSIGYSAADYSNLDSMIMSWDAATSSLNVDVVIKTAPFTYTYHDFGTTTNEVLDDFLENGGKVFTPTIMQKDLRSKMLGNNYIQSIYQFGDDASTTGYTGIYVFHEDYFLQMSYSGNVASGIIELHGKDPNSKESLNGLYSVMVNYAAGDDEPIVQYSPRLVTDKYTPVTYYGYPSLLSIWNSMEYMTGWDTKVFTKFDYVPEGPTDGQFCITDPTLVYEIQNSFGILNSFEGAVPVAVGIDCFPSYDEVTKQYKDVVMFVLKFMYGDVAYNYLCPFTNFGTTRDAYLDAFIEIIKNTK